MSLVPSNFVSAIPMVVPLIPLGLSYALTGSQEFKKALNVHLKDFERKNLFLVPQVSVEEHQNTIPKFFEAIKNNNVSCVQTMLKEGMNVDSLNNKGYSALMVAAKHNHIEIVENLLRSGANIFKESEENKDILTYLNENKFSAEIKALLSLYMNKFYKYMEKIKDNKDLNEVIEDHAINTRVTSKGDSLLHMAVLNDREKSVASLLKRGADPYFYDYNGQTPFYDAIMNNKKKSLQKFIEFGTVSNCQNFDYILGTSLHFDMETIQMLVNAGANINALHNTWGTLLHLATEKKNYTVINDLLSLGADSSFKGNQKSSPMEIAVSLDDSAALSIFNSFMANSSLKFTNTTYKRVAGVQKYSYGDQMTSGEKFFEAIKNNKVSSLETLLKEGIDVDCLNNKGYTALMVAAKHNHIEIVEKLLQYGANLYKESEENKSILTYMRENKFSAEIEALLLLHFEKINKCIDNIQNNKDLNELIDDLNKNIRCHHSGMSLLHMAVLFDNEKVVEFLLKKGADPFFKDYEGKSPFYFAIAGNKKQSLQKFIEFGTVSDCQDFDYIVAASLHFDMKTIEMLVDAGADINASHEEWGTLLHLATEQKNYTVIDSLLNLGANSSFQGSKEFSPITRALTLNDQTLFRKFLLFNKSKPLANFSIPEDNDISVLNSLSDEAQTTKLEKFVFFVQIGEYLFNFINENPQMIIIAFSGIMLVAMSLYMINDYLLKQEYNSIANELERFEESLSKDFDKASPFNCKAYYDRRKYKKSMYLSEDQEVRENYVKDQRFSLFLEKAGEIKFILNKHDHTKILTKSDKEKIGKIIEDSNMLNCPISHVSFQAPVILVESGNSYEESSIKSWFTTRRTDPLTNVDLGVRRGLLKNDRVNDAQAVFQNLLNILNR